MFEFDMVKLVILLLTGPFIEFNCSRYRCSSERVFFLLRNIRKIDGTFKSVRAIHGIRPIRVQGPRFDCIYKINSRVWLGPVNSNFHFEDCRYHWWEDFWNLWTIIHIRSPWQHSLSENSNHLYIWTMVSYTSWWNSYLTPPG